MNENPNWLQRVFGSSEAEEKLAAATSALARQAQTVLQLERELASDRSSLERYATDAAKVKARETALEKAVSELRTEGDSLRASVAEADARAGAAEAQLKDDVAKAALLRRAVSDESRKSAARSLELDTLRKKLASTEAHSADLRARCDALAQSLRSRERQAQDDAERLAAAEAELAELRTALARTAKEHEVLTALKRTQVSLEGALSEAERQAQDNVQRLATAEEEIAKLRAELERAAVAHQEVDALKRAKISLEGATSRAELDAKQARRTVTELKASAQRQASKLQDLERDAARLRQSAETRDALLNATKQDLLDIACLSARALQASLGGELHLAMEVGFAATYAAPLPPENHDGTSDREACIEDVCRRLTTLGLASECKVELRQEYLMGRLSLPASVEPADALPLARWVAAYATGCMNRKAESTHRLERIEGGPAEFTFVATPRAVSRH